MSEQLPSHNGETPREIIDKLPDWGAKPERSEAENTSPNFIDYADLIIDQAGEVEPQETLEGVHALIRGVENAANDGRIVTSKGEVQTSDYIDHILDLYLGWANMNADKREPESPLIYLTRKGGLQSAFNELANDENTAKVLIDALMQRKYERDKSKMAVPRGDDLQGIMGAEQARQIVGVESELEPAEREKIEAELAEEALEETVERPEEPSNKEAEVSPWSREGAEKRRAERQQGSKEDPIELGVEDVQLATTVEIDGRSVRAVTSGYYVDEHGVTQMVLSPKYTSDAKLFEGKIITKSQEEILAASSSDKLSKHIDSWNEEQSQELADRLKEPISDNDESGYAISMDEFRELKSNYSERSNTNESSLTKEEYLEKLTDGFTDEDKDNLKQYADIVLMVEGARRRREFDNVFAWNRELQAIGDKLSEQARAIADRYAHAYLHY